MKVYIVMTMGRIWGVYTNKEVAEEARDNANYDAEMNGGRGGYAVYEKEVKEEA